MTTPNRPTESRFSRVHIHFGSDGEVSTIEFSDILLAPRFLMGSPLCSDECRRTMCLPRHFTRSISAWFVEASDPRARSPR